MMTKVIFLFLTILCCTSCVKTLHVSGHLFEENDLERLKIIKSKQELEGFLGSPTTTSDFGPETWYYITSKKESVAFFKEKVIEQKIVAVTFKKDNNIDSITMLTEKNMKNHNLAPEITVVRGNNTTAAQQFFHNVGRFNKNKKQPPQMPRSGF